MDKKNTRKNAAKSTGKKPQYAAPAVDRMLDIVEFLAEQHRPFGVTELAKTLDITTNSVFRIMRRLAERGYAIIDPESGGYQLGPRFFTLGMRLSARFELRRNAHKHLEWLCRELGETCQLHIPDGDKTLVLDSVNPQLDFFFQVMPGSRVYYHANAFGKCILAFMDTEEVRKLIGNDMPKLTKHTITDIDTLIAELAEVRKTGIGQDVQEYNAGIYCLGAPVFDVNAKVIAGIGMTALEMHFDSQHRDQLEKQVLTAAARVATDIGYAGKFYEERLATYES